MDDYPEVSSSENTSDGGYQLSDYDDVNANTTVRQGRYRGPKSTYLSFIEEEKQLHESLLKIRDADLSAHLFNTHKLKSKHYHVLDSATPKGSISKDEWRKKDEDGNKQWVPPTAWTAWPLPAEHVRQLELSTAKDGLDQYTFRAKKDMRPSATLEELLTGLMLKSARERFETRELETPPPVNDHAATEVIVDTGDNAGVTDNVLPIEESIINPSAIISSNAQLQPIIALDDETSASLLRPSVRHILSKLDDVLTVLHHTKPSGTSTSEGNKTNRQKRPGTDSRSQSHGSEGDNTDNEATAPESVHSKTSKRVLFGGQGPEEGETQMEWLLRIARKQRRTVAVIAKSRGITLPPVPKKRWMILGDSGPVEDESKIEWLHRLAKREHRTMQRVAEQRGIKIIQVEEKIHDDEVAVSDSTEKSPAPSRERNPQPSEGESQIEWLKRLAKKEHRSVKVMAKRCGVTLSPELEQSEDQYSNKASRRRARRQPNVRDWSEVVGSAALAGLPKDVIEKTTLRCADLFGEGMDLQILGTGNVDDQLQSYMPSVDDHSDTHSDVSESGAEFPPPRLPKFSRFDTTNDFLSKQMKEASDRDDSSHASSLTDIKIDKDNIYYCSIPTCKHYHGPYNNREALQRHYRQIHKTTETAARFAQAIQKSNEIHDGVHTDGFLQIIDLDDGPAHGYRKRKRKRNTKQEDEQLESESQAEWLSRLARKEHRSVAVVARKLGVTIEQTSE